MYGSDLWAGNIIDIVKNAAAALNQLMATNNWNIIYNPYSLCKSFLKIVKNLKEKKWWMRKTQINTDFDNFDINLKYLKKNS